MRKVFLVLLALVLTFSVGLVACGGAGEQEEEEEEADRTGEQEEEEVIDIAEPIVEIWQPEVHGEVTFSQLEWMNSPREVLYPYSNVGVVEFTFEDEAGEWLVDEDGGWLNVVIDTTAAGGQIMWSVQNLYLKYNDVDDLLDSQPSVQFSLGLDNDTPLEVLEAAVFLSSEPLDEQPDPQGFSGYRVSRDPYLVGDACGWTSALSDIPENIGSWIGPPFTEEDTATIADVDIVAIDEEWFHDVEGAAARAIHYLGDVHGFHTDAPQAIYEAMKECMPDQFKKCSYTGTPLHLIIDAKDCYELHPRSGRDLHNIGMYNNLDVNVPNGWNWDELIDEVMASLDNGCAVEVIVVSGKDPDYDWGHMAMVTSVTKHTDGSTTIRYVDDFIPGDGIADNQERVIALDSNGGFLGPEDFVVDEGDFSDPLASWECCYVQAFVIECVYLVE